MLYFLLPTPAPVASAKASYLRALHIITHAAPMLPPPPFLHSPIARKHLFEPLPTWSATCRHSRLSGSRDLENWLITAGDSMESAVNDNMVKPLRKVSGGLFQRYKR